MMMSYYEGDFYDDLRTGIGKVYYSNGNLQYEGDFLDNAYEKWMA